MSEVILSFSSKSETAAGMAGYGRLINVWWLSAKEHSVEFSRAVKH
jgi:hypothetical protein